MPSVRWRIFALIIVCGAALRFIHLGNDLWLDEIGTLVTYLRLPIDDILRTYRSANQHLLYSVLGHLSILIFGESAWAARLPAALFGIGAIPAMYYMARAIASEKEALLGTAFLAFSYHHVWFSQDARGYSAMVFFTLLGTGILLRVLERGGARLWIAYTATMTLGVLSLLNTFFVVAGQAFAVLLARKKARVAPMLGSAAAVVVLAALGHILMFGQMVQFFRTADRTALGWSNLRELAPVVMNGLVVGVGLVGAIAAGLTMFAGWYSYWRQTPLVGAILVLPAVLNVAALVVLHIGAYPRSFLYALPFALLIAVRGLFEICSWCKIPGLAPWLAAALIALTALPLAQYYRYPKQDFTGARRFVEEHRQPGDPVAAVDLAGRCYETYYDPVILVPKSAAAIEALRAGGRHVWVLYTLPREFRLRAPELFNYVRAMDRQATIRGTLGGGDLIVVRTP